MNMSVNIYHISSTISSRETRKFSVAVLKLACLKECKKMIHYTNIYVGFDVVTAVAMKCSII
jgi:hypothetical protein